MVQGGVTSAILKAVVAKDLPGAGTGVPARRLEVDRAITGAVEVLEVREDKPITKLATSVRRQDRVVVLEGTAVYYTMDLGACAPRP